MDVRMSFALLAALCAGCGAQPQNATTARSDFGAAVPVQRDAGSADGTMDVILIDQTCYSYSECRTTTQGLGV